MIQDKIYKAHNNSHYGSFAAIDMGPKHVDVRHTDNTRILKLTGEDGKFTININSITILPDADASLRLEKVKEYWFGDKPVSYLEVLGRVIEAGLRELCEYPYIQEE